MAKTFLDGAYSHGAGRDAEAFYDEWATSYDEELTENGYATPVRCAKALAAVFKEADAPFSRPLLDLGCGTGLSGAALRVAGFTRIDGWDPSAEMLRRAEARGVYRVLRETEAGAPISAAKDAYDAVVAAGVLSPGLAPPETIDEVVAFLPQGGWMAFSLNDHAFEDCAYEGRVMELTDTGAVTVELKEYGPHIPAREIGAWVYVLRKVRH